MWRTLRTLWAGGGDDWLRELTFPAVWPAILEAEAGMEW
jgi:hypothetical protein